MLKLSNTIGVPFRNFVSTQLKLRAEGMSTDTRSIQDVLYIANKTAWVRLASSINVSFEYLDLLSDYYSEREGEPLDISGVAMADVGTLLAHNWVLQSGTSKVNNDNEVTLRSGIGTDGAYGLGGITSQGYRPMPGLTSINIETAGRMGSLRFATIELKVWNMSQLDIIDALYFRLGLTMLLEWGHVEYKTNDNKIQTNVSGIDTFFKEGVSKEEILVAINDKIEESCGNYDGMLGTVCNYNYSMNQEGGYDCSIKLVGLGSLLETQKINSTYSMPAGLAKNFLLLQRGYTAMLNASIDKANARAKDNATKAAKANAQSAYDAAVTAFDASHKIKDLQSLYANIFDTATTKAPIYKTTDKDRVTDLYKYTIVSPNSNFLYYLNQNKPNAVYVSTTRASNNYTLGYLDKDDKVHPAWITSVYGGTNSGYLFPLAAKNKYKVDRTFLENVFKTTLPQIARSSGNPISFITITNSLIKAVAYSGPTYGNGNDIQKLVSSRTVQGSINQNIEIIYEGGAANGQGPIVIKQEVDSWKSGARIKAISGPDWDNVVRLGFTILSDAKAAKQDILEYMIPQIDRIYNTVPSDWYLSSDPAIGDLKNAGQLSTGGTESAKYATITMEQGIEVKGIQLEDSTGKKFPSKVNLVFTIEVVTEIPTLLKELIELAPGQEAIPVLGAATAAPVTSTAHVTEQATDGGFNNLGSALEAMLTFVQYDAVVDKTPGVLVKSIQKAAANIIGDLPAAPMAKLFTKDALDPNYPKPVEPTPTNSGYFTDPYYLGLKGYNSSLMSGQVNNGNNANTGNPTTTPGPTPIVDTYKEVPTVKFEELMYSYRIPKSYTDSGQAGDIGSELKPVYIKLGFLLFFINNVCLLFDSTKPNKGSKAARPHFYIDFNPETNLCLTAPYQMSVDPTVCLLPWKGTQDDYKEIFKSNLATPPKDLFDFGSDILSGTICKNPDGCYRTNKAYAGKTMNILVNTQHLLNILHDTTNRDGHADVYFKPFIDRLLEDLNKAMGDINAFRLGYIDSSNTAAILDDQFVPPLDSEISIMQADKSLMSPSGYAIIPIFGKRSIARTLDFQTNISTKMSNLIAIGARSPKESPNKGSTQSTDGSSFHWLNVGLTDRIITQAEDIAKTFIGPVAPTGATTTPPAVIKVNNDELAKKFNEYIASIYGNGKDIDKAGISPSTNYYIQATTHRKAVDPGTSGAPVIPLNLSFSTDGISGITMGNAFMIPEDKLPISLRAFTDGMPRFAYMVMGLNHKVESNQWITDVRGQIIRLRTDESYASAKGVSSAKAAGGGGGGTQSTGNLKNDLTPAVVAYLSHQQGDAGISSILYYTFKDPQLAVPNPNPISKNTDIQGNMDSNINTAQFNSVVGPSLPHSPENYLKYQVYLFNKKYQEAQTKTKYDSIFQPLSTTYGVPLDLIRTACNVESSFNPNSITKSGTYKGLFQLDDREFLRYNPGSTASEIFDPAKNANAGVQLLKGYLQRAQAKIDKYIV